MLLFTLPSTPGTAVFHKEGQQLPEGYRFLIIGLRPQMAPARRPQMAPIGAPKWPWITSPIPRFFGLSADQPEPPFDRRKAVPERHATLVSFEAGSRILRVHLS